MNKKPPVGRGLAALMGEESVASAEVQEVDINSIVPNPYQPRKIFDEDKLNELVNSIKNQGILQPILLSKDGDGKYTLIIGERRWRAAKIAGLEKIPAIVKNMSKKEIMESALIENIQREDLNPLDVAEAYKSLIDEFKYTQEELSNIVSKSRSAIANTIRLLKLPDYAKDALRKGIISEGHGRALLAVENEKERLKLFKKLTEEKIPVREAEKRSKKKLKDQNILALEERLSKTLKTKVKIEGKAKKGKIIIEYYSLEQFEEILSNIERE